MSPFGSKALLSVTSPLRMETPVIYFYPEKPLRVSATVTFLGGHLTEWFPAARPNPQGMAQLLFAPSQVAPSVPITWEGDLFPPADEMAQSQIPAVAAGKGDHYRHAREVPQAWIFRSTTPAPRLDQDPARGKDADKYIFYRGIGQNPPPFQAQAGDDDSVTLRRWGGSGAISTAFALTVGRGKASWTRMPSLEALRRERPTDSQTATSVRLNSADLPVEEAAQQLAAAIREALTSAGLSTDEAHAMVATWDGHWFREPGTRILAILPREWVDEVLPLKIQPEPTKVTRVFVARFEMLTPQRESAVLALLTGNVEGDTPAAQFREMQLGRFANGALVRAQAMESRRMSERFGQLHRSVENAAPDSKSTAAVK
jgi:hypothetical protein